MPRTPKEDPKTTPSPAPNPGDEGVVYDDEDVFAGLDHPVNLNGGHAPDGSAARVRDDVELEDWSTPDAPETNPLDPNECRDCGCHPGDRCSVVKRVVADGQVVDESIGDCEILDEEAGPICSRCKGDEVAAGQTFQDEAGQEHPTAEAAAAAAAKPAKKARAKKAKDQPESPPMATGYNAQGEAIDQPIDMRPTPPPKATGQATMIDEAGMAQLKTGVWSPVDGYSPNSVELKFSGRVELSNNAHDRALADALRLNSRHIVRAYVRVDERTAKVMRKKGAFDGVTVKVPLFVYGIGLVGAADADGEDLGEEPNEMLLLNQIDTLTGKLEGIGDAAASLLEGKGATPARMRAFLKNLAELAADPAPTDPNDDPAPDVPDAGDLSPLEEAMAEASAQLDAPTGPDDVA